MIQTLRTSFAIALAAVACCAFTPAARAGSRLDELTVLHGGWPRAFFFRQAEGIGIRMHEDYAKWNPVFDRLMGIEGKTLEEEVPGRSANIPLFTRFKKEHPHQLVMLHYNGNARDPRSIQRGTTYDFFAGHWLYFNGATIEQDVPAQTGRTEIHVSNPHLFHAGIGRYRDANEDVGLCELDASGKPDWSRCEQVQLISVDVKRHVIVVQRGCYGTKPRAFAAGHAYAAAHVCEGPWGRHSHLLWAYNYSTTCPRDAEGRTAGDVLADELAARFAPSGELAAYDGLEFDVLRHDIRPPHHGIRGIDTNGDGQIDFGWFDGVNEYGRGVLAFLTRLRQHLGDDRLILADGFTARHQRGFGILNGIESEGWPDLNDPDVTDWSGGLNRHFYWETRGRAPVFNYVNHKFVEHGDKPGDVHQPDVPWRIDRLVFAAACFTDSAICYSNAPPTEPGETYAVWDELDKGTDHEVGWLGQPLSDPVRLATKHPDQLHSFDLAKHLTVTGATIRVDGSRVTLTPTAGDAKDADAADAITLTLHDIPCDGPDLLLIVNAHGDALAAYPPTMAREITAALANGDHTPTQRHQSWVGRKPFESTFYFHSLTGKNVDVVMQFEGRAPIVIDRLAAYAAPDVIVRPYEHGLIVANPAPHPVTLDLAALRPGEHYRRISGSTRQDQTTNNGEPVLAPIQLEGKDALFLVRDPQ